MPGIAEHCTETELVSRILGIGDDDFLVGSVLPDVMSGDKDTTHFRKTRAFYLVPSVTAANKGLKLAGGLKKGCLNHFLFDKHTSDAQVPRLRRVGGENLFSSGKVYEDYTRMNYRLLEFFGIDKEKWNKVLKHTQHCGVPIDAESHRRIVESFNMPLVKDEPVYYDFKKYCDFIVDMSFKVAEDLEKLM